MSYQISVMVGKDIHEEELEWILEFDYIPGYSQTWEDPGCGPEISFNKALFYDNGKVLETLSFNDFERRFHISAARWEVWENQAIEHVESLEPPDWGDFEEEE